MFDSKGWIAVVVSAYPGHMCASYGLGGGPYGELGLSPLDERENKVLLNEWASGWGGKANITRNSKKGTNLNPVIHVDGGERVLDFGWWWFHVGGRPAKFQASNSRDDNLVSKWKGGFQHRALLPARWYVEGGKTWSRDHREVFAMAAILSPRDLPGGGTGLAYSLVTREGIGEASSVVTARGDSRMPLVLPAELHDEWLNPERPGDEGLVRLVQAGSREISLDMTANPVGGPEDKLKDLLDEGVPFDHIADILGITEEEVRAAASA